MIKRVINKTDSQNDRIEIRREFDGIFYIIKLRLFIGRYEYICSDPMYSWECGSFLSYRSGVRKRVEKAEKNLVENAKKYYYKLMDEKLLPDKIIIYFLADK